MSGHTEGPWTDALRQKREEREARERIERAAPEMYEALSGLVAYAQQLELLVYSPDDKDEHPAIAKARAALAKASGAPSEGGA